MNKSIATSPSIQELGISPDALAHRQAELLALIRQTVPEVMADNQIDVEKLKELLGQERIASDEHYELNWAGKSAARREIQKTSSLTLRPDVNNPANAQHMLIEGENLEVLRVLQKSYYGKIKMIYIDPPYNTGNDSFVYPDDYSETLEEYQKRTGEKNEAGYLNKQSLWKKNSKESGQYHSAWLSMMYPRLYMARNLLQEDGVIFISIDDHEVSNLKSLSDEIFGSENFVAQFIWNKQHSQQQGLFKKYHEYVLLYAKNLNVHDNISGGDGQIDAGAMKKISKANPASEFTFPAGVRFDAPDGFELQGTYGDSEQVTVDTSDFLVVEFIQLQQKIDGHHPPGFNQGVFWLLLDQVVQFFPIKSDDAWTFEGDADKAGVAISAAVFELQWVEWSRNQMVNQACMNGLALCRSFGLGNGASIDESELSHWRGLALRSCYPSTPGLGFEDIQELLLKSTESLFDLVREDSANGSIFISGPIEWINLRSNTNFLEHDLDLADQAQGLHEKYWSHAFDPCLSDSEDIDLFSSSLKGKFPDMFPGPWSPELIALYVRYSHLIKFGSVQPEEIIAAVNAIRKPDDQSSAQLLAFLIGVSLGANKVHALDRLLHPLSFRVATSNVDTAQVTDPISMVNSLQTP